MQQKQISSSEACGLTLNCLKIYILPINIQRGKITKYNKYQTWLKTGTLCITHGFIKKLEKRKVYFWLPSHFWSFLSSFFYPLCLIEPQSTMNLPAAWGTPQFNHCAYCISARIGTNRSSFPSLTHFQFAEKFQEVKEAAKLAREKSQEKGDTLSNHSQVNDIWLLSPILYSAQHICRENEKWKCLTLARFPSPTPKCLETVFWHRQVSKQWGKSSTP